MHVMSAYYVSANVRTAFQKRLNWRTGWRVWFWCFQEKYAWIAPVPGKGALTKPREGKQRHVQVRHLELTKTLIPHFIPLGNGNKTEMGTLMNGSRPDTKGRQCMARYSSKDQHIFDVMEEDGFLVYTFSYILVFLYEPSWRAETISIAVLMHDTILSFVFQKTHYPG